MFETALRDRAVAIYLTRPPSNVCGAWLGFLDRADVATHYTSPAYFDEPQLRGRNPFAILIYERGCIAGVITGTIIGDRVQSGLSVRPQISVGRVVDRADIIRPLVAGLRLLSYNRCVTVYSWSAEDPFDGYVRTPQDGVVMIDLQMGAAAIFKEFSDKQGVRRAIRKAISSGVKVEMTSTVDDVAEFYAVYLDWAKRKGIPSTPLPDFQEQFSLTSNRRLFVARLSGNIIAGSVVRMHVGGLIEYSGNSSLEQYQAIRPNDLLQWRIIEWACQEGLRSYSLGSSHFFLRKFGRTIAPIYRYQLDQTRFHRYQSQERLINEARRIWHLVPERLRVEINSLRYSRNEARTQRNRSS
jgi:hypothetical protein